MSKTCRHCGRPIQVRPRAGWPRRVEFEWFHVETSKTLCDGVRVPVAEPREEDGDGRD